MRDLAAVILAAGLGKRMKSGVVKVLHPLRGKPLLKYVVDAARGAGIARIIVVIGHQADAVKEAMGDGLDYAVQVQQLGTGHAVMQAEALLKDFEGDVIVLYGDTPFLTPELLTNLADCHARGGYGATIVTAIVDDPSGYGRILRGADGVERIVEDRDCTPVEKSIKEINSGIYCFQSRRLFEALKALRPENAQGEYYLTDAVEGIKLAGGRIGALRVDDPLAVMGINDRKQLAWAEGILRKKKVDALMEAGVTVVDPSSVFVDDEVEVGPDTVIKPFTFIEGPSRIGSRCVIGPSTRVWASVIGNDCTVEFSVVEEGAVEDGAVVGPFSHLRPGCRVGMGAKIGNFTEIKNSVIGARAKIPHHSYVGDSDIGPDVNIGAGSVTVNYDGRRKHRTVIDEGAFIGCNSNLVAPVRVGRGAYVAAGSTINRDVPDGALGIARARQENKDGWALRRR